MSFKEDLEKWEKEEERVLKVLNEEFNYDLIKNPDWKWVDLIPNSWIEVKMDEYSLYSWNYYIEVECNWKPSWIYKDEVPAVKEWIQSNWEYFLKIEMEKLRSYVWENIELCKKNKSNTSRWHRYVSNWWDWGRSKGLLVPVEKLKEIADLVYIY